MGHYVTNSYGSSQHVLFCCLQVSVMQLSPSELLVQCHDDNLHLLIKSELHVNGIYTTKVGPMYSYTSCICMYMHV